MKTAEEIQEMLVLELCKNLDKIDSKISLDYYNELLGDTSFLLAGFLNQKLKDNFNDWDVEKWIDDSLLRRVNFNKNKISIWWVIIWGKEEDTEQWTEPFYFEIILNEDCTDFIKSTLLFSDLNNPEITYEEYNNNRNFWDNDYYQDNRWQPHERNWKYIINTPAERRLQT